jgi:hypothetical protein
MLGDIWYRLHYLFHGWFSLFYVFVVVVVVVVVFLFCLLLNCGVCSHSLGRGAYEPIDPGIAERYFGCRQWEAKCWYAYNG